MDLYAKPVRLLMQHEYELSLTLKRVEADE